MTASRAVFAFIGLFGLATWLLVVMGIDLAGPFGFLNPGVDFHSLGAGPELGWGITGAMMVAWWIAADGLLMGRAPIPTLRWSALVWYLLDGTVSVTSGMWPNVISNTGFLLAILAATATYHAPRAASAPQVV